MKKFGFIGALLVCFTLAKSQETLKSTLLDVNKNATVLDGLIADIATGLKKDKHNDLERLAVSIKNELSAIDQKLMLLAEPDRAPIISVVNLYNTEVDNFQKLTNKSRLFDKDKLLDEAFDKIKNRHSELRQLLKSTYTTILQKEEQKKVEKQPEQSKDNVKTDEPANEPDANIKILGLVTGSKQMIELYIDSIHLAMKKNKFSEVSKYGRLISNDCLQIEDLSLLLKSDQKESIRILTAGLRSYADELQEHARKGIASHHQMHEVLEKMEIKLSSLITGLSLIQ